MNFNFLLINPWIYDFAAYNFWAKPLGLLKVAEFLSCFNVNLTLIDCCDSFKVKKFGTGKYDFEIIEKPSFLKDIPRKYKRYGISESHFIENIKKVGKIDLVLITSIMAYWWLGVKRVVDIVKDIYPSVPVILGGIYSTLYREHAEKNIGANFVYTGAVRNLLIEIIDKFGFNLKRLYKSPKYWWQMGFYKKMDYAPILTSVGCPFRCHYCASSILANSYERRQISDVIDEIKGLYQLGTKDFAFYDDALLFRSEENIKPLLRELIKEKVTLRFHTPNGLHARFIDEELAILMKVAGFKTVRLSLETIDIKRQYESGGKVTNSDIEKAIFYLKKACFSSREIGVYLMYGLPNQTLDEVKAGVEFLKRLKVKIHLTEFSPIKGTAYWQELLNMGVIEDNLDPIFTNNSVWSEIFCPYNRTELEKIKIDVKQFNLLL